MSSDKPAMDIVDWLRMKTPSPGLGLGSTCFDYEHEALERLVNRNQDALRSLVQNRKELIDICMAKELKRLC